MASFMECLPLPVSYQEASTIVSIFSDPVIKDNGHDTYASFFTHSAWTPPYPCNWVARLFVVYWFLVVVSHGMSTGFPLPYEY